MGLGGAELRLDDGLCVFCEAVWHSSCRSLTNYGATTSAPEVGQGERVDGWYLGFRPARAPRPPAQRPHLSEKRDAALWLTCCSGFSGGHLELVASTCQTIKWVVLMLVI